MDQVKFWQSWYKSDRIGYIIGLVIFFLVLLYFCIAYFFGNSWVYPWRIINNFEPVEVPFHQVLTGIYNFTIGGSNYINLQEFVGDSINILPPTAYFLLALLLIAFSVIMAVLSSFKRFWFLAFLTIIIFLFLLLQLDSLELFGQYNRSGVIVALAIFLIPAYVINAYYDHFTLQRRILIFLLVSVIFAMLIFFFAEVPTPLFHFINFGLALPLVLSVIFILLVSHDIISFFMMLITNSNNDYSKNSDIHFVVISLLYLLSLTFTYLYEINYIDWDIIYINPFIILTIAAIAGIWEFRKKRNTYQEIMHFHSVGAFFYLALAIVCFATLAYFMATANDAALEAITELILASQIGFGLTFFIYVLVNFFTILHHNHAVYKVLYKPTRMPYFTANLAGFLATLGFFLSANSDMYYEARAAIYNAMGDVALHNQQIALAEELYTQSTIYGFKNHHAHYALGSIKLQQQKAGEALYYFEEAIEKEPTENAYSIIGNLYKSNDRFFEALFAMQDGLQKFPASGYLLNNTGLLYNKTAVVDSTLYYLEKASGTSQKDAAVANQYGIYGLNKLTFATDSIISLYEKSSTIEQKTNLLLLLNFSGITSRELPYIIEEDSSLSFNQYAYLQNFITYQAHYFDSTRVRQFGLFANKAVDFFSEPMLFNQAITNYLNQQVYQAFNLLDQLSNQSIEKESFYKKVKALLALESDAPLLSQIYLAEAEALAEGQENLQKPMLMASLQSGDLLTLSNQVLIDREKFESQFPSLVTFLDLYADADSVNWQQQSDTIKYMAVKYIDNIKPEVALTIQSPFLQIKAVIEIIDQMLSQGPGREARKYISILENNEESYFKAELLRLKMKYYWRTEQLDSLQTMLKLPHPKVDLYNIFYQAKLALKNDNLKKATSLYRLAASMNPMAEDVIVEAADYFENQDELLTAYQILVDAIKINRFSTKITEAYIRVSLKSGLESFAASALDTYQEKVSYQQSLEMNNYFDSLRLNITDVWQENN